MRSAWRGSTPDACRGTRCGNVAGRRRRLGRPAALRARRTSTRHYAPASALSHGALPRVPRRDNGGIDMAARRAGERRDDGAADLHGAAALLRRPVGDPRGAGGALPGGAGGGGDPAGARGGARRRTCWGWRRPDDAKWERASAGLTKELERSTALGVGAVCFHPGSAGKSERGRGGGAGGAGDHGGAARRWRGARGCWWRTPPARGAPSAAPRRRSPPSSRTSPTALRPRTGYGLDTCHLYASGYDIAASRERLGEILDEFEEAIGEPPAFFHLNDSEGELGSNRDRHALLGEGEIGQRALRLAPRRPPQRRHPPHPRDAPPQRRDRRRRPLSGPERRGDDAGAEGRVRAASATRPRSPPAAAGSSAGARGRAG